MQTIGERLRVNRLLTAWAAGALLACGVSGCQSLTASQGGEVAAVAGRATSIRAGEFLSVRLPANPSTGFAWVLRPWDEAVLTPSVPFNAVEPGPRGDGQVGTPGETVWRFSAGTAGAVTLTFDYRQPWSDAAAAQTATFPVTVR